MEFKGTKSKWYINRYGNVVTENEEVAYMPSLTKKEHKEANALLISKAPEMLEMIKLLIDRLEENDLKELSAVKRAKQLIKEATEI